jgi:hypothetical protein
MTETKGQGLHVLIDRVLLAARNVESQNQNDLIGSNLLSELATQIVRSLL